jgi:hypothetical protein
MMGSFDVVRHTKEGRSIEPGVGMGFASNLRVQVALARTDQDEVMSKPRSSSWKMERASVTVQSRSRPRSNKYSRSDDERKPMPGERTRVWVGGYQRSDGTKVAGHYRAAH